MSLTEPPTDLSDAASPVTESFKLLNGKDLAISIASASRASFSLSSRPCVKYMTQEKRKARIVLKSVYSESKSGISLVYFKSKSRKNTENLS